MQHDISSVLLNRVLVRLYESVSSINAQIHQVQADVQYLVHTGQITQEDATFILSKVPLTTDPSASVHSTSLLDSPSPTSAAPTPVQVHHGGLGLEEGRRRPVPKIPVANTFFHARVIWDYNVDNERPEDLTLYVGDILEVEESSTETNPDWWTGKIRGQTGLFPSAYVERILHALPPSPAPPAIMKSSRPSSEVSAPTYTPYRSTHVAMQFTPGGGPNGLGLQPVGGQEDEAKRGKYDHLKSTMTNPAARGVGFGAGAALASGVVRHLF